jgi:hypothetical protein
LLAALLSGCGGDGRVEVSGRVVRADGSPLSGARVIARSEATGKSASDSTNAEGQYKLGGEIPGDGVLPGEYAVIVIEDRGQTDGMRPASIAAKYADPAQSGLAFSVAPGESKTFDITVDAR